MIRHDTDDMSTLEMFEYACSIAVREQVAVFLEIFSAEEILLLLKTLIDLTIVQKTLKVLCVILRWGSEFCGRKPPVPLIYNLDPLQPTG
jgi:hypothetical protein